MLQGSQSTGETQAIIKWYLRDQTNHSEDFQDDGKLSSSSSQFGEEEQDQE